MKPTNKIITIMMADDHEIYRDGFAVMFRKSTDIKLVADARNGQQLVMLAEQHRPDVILTDIKMPVMDGIEATRILTEKLPGTAIIALSMLDDEDSILEMIKAGASGYLQKNAHKQVIIEAIHLVSEGNPYYCNSTTLKMARRLAGTAFGKDAESNKTELTAREKEILCFICEEKTSEEIAALMHLSPRTIEGYRQAIIAKAGTRNLAGLAVFAIRHGIFKP